jgi:hypothetical protein
MPIKIFFSYSHKDSDIKEYLDTHFAPLKRSGKVQTWNDRDITLGNEWNDEIKQQLEEADIILLLISASFIASNYIWDNELKRAMERHEARTARVIPIFAKKCEFQDMPFAKLQGLPQDAKPIASFADPDEPCADIASKIRKLIDSIEANAPQKATMPTTNLSESDKVIYFDLIGKNKIDDALKFIKEKMPNKTELVSIQNRWHEFQMNSIKNTLYPQDKEVLKAKIIDAMLALA